MSNFLTTVLLFLSLLATAHTTQEPAYEQFTIVHSGITAEGGSVPELRGKRVTMKRLLTKGDHSLNKLAKAVWETFRTEIIVVNSENPYLSTTAYGTFIEGEKGHPDRIIVAESAINNGTIQHEIIHNVFSKRRKSGKVSIFDGVITTGNSNYPGEHTLEEYFTFPANFVLLKEKKIILTKAKIYQGMIKDAAETITAFEQFIEILPSSFGEMRFFRSNDSLTLTTTKINLDVKIKNKNGVVVDLSDSNKRSNMRLVFQMGTLPDISDLYAALNSNDAYGPVDLKALQNPSWHSLFTEIQSQLKQFTSYLIENDRLVKIIEANANNDIYDPKPPKDLLRLAVRAMKTGQTDLAPPASKAVEKSATRGAKLSSVSNVNSKLDLVQPTQVVLAPVRKISPAISPQRLYHWTSLAYVESYLDSELFPLKKTPTTGTSFESMNGDFRGVPVLYTWSHPITGLALNEREIHGGDLLIALDIKKDARAVVLESLGNHPDNRIYSPSNLAELREKFKDVDLILHTFGSKQNPFFQEWIVLNPKAIERITMDPKELMPLVKEEVSKLRNSNYTYTRDQLFSFATKFVNSLPVGPYYADMAFRNALADFIEEHYISNEENIQNHLTSFNRCAETLAKIGNSESLLSLTPAGQLLK